MKLDHPTHRKGDTARFGPRSGFSGEGPPFQPEATRKDTNTQTVIYLPAWYLLSLFPADLTNTGASLRDTQRYPLVGGIQRHIPGDRARPVSL